MTWPNAFPNHDKASTDVSFFPFLKNEKNESHPIAETVSDEALVDAVDGPDAPLRFFKQVFARFFSYFLRT